MAQEVQRLSYSKINTLQTCSYLYYAQYVLKLPQGKNDGSIRGSLLHSIFELLQKPRHKHIVSELKTPEGVKNHKSINRFIVKNAKKEGINTEENLVLIYEM